MGFYRFALAVGVVFFHVGNGSWVVGRTAVFCFYFVSGFLICRVLETAYWGSASSIAAFYCNRALRLLPLYAVISILTVLLLSSHGSSVFPLGGNDTTLTLLSERLAGGGVFADLAPRLNFYNEYNIPLLTGGSDTIPQGWSIGVEIIFYVIAPLLVLLGRGRVWPLATLALLATALFVYGSLTGPDVRYVDEVIYKNAFTSAFMFFWGAVAYAALRDTKFRVPLYVSVPIVALFAYYIYFLAGSEEYGTREMTAASFVVNNLLAIPVSALVCFTAVPDGLRRWESRFGDLTYGIYLNHFLVAASLLWIAEAYGAPIFGRYNKPEFGLWTAIVCVFLAFATFHLVERQVERLRRFIKMQSVALPSHDESIANPAASSAGSVRRGGGL